MSDDSTTRFLSDVQLATRFAISRSTIWRWAQVLPDFPKPKKIGPGTSRWSLAEIERYEQAKAGD